MKPIQLQLSLEFNEESLSAFVELLERVIRQTNTEAAHGVVDALKGGSNKPKAGGKAKDDASRSVSTRIVRRSETANQSWTADRHARNSEATKLSERTIWEMNSSGKMPKAIRIGRAVRWSFDELKEWIAEGCPARAKWEQRRATKH